MGELLRAEELLADRTQVQTEEETRTMDATQTQRFWERAHLQDQARELTPTEQAFVDAAMRYGRSRWDGECDVERMKQLLEQEPSLLATVGQAIVNITVAVRGCASALELLLDRGLRFSVESWRSRPGQESEYDNVHEAAWAGAADNLRVLLERGMADARSLSNPHTGWPDNVSLLYWVANSGRRPGAGQRVAGAVAARPRCRPRGALQGQRRAR